METPDIPSSHGQANPRNKSLAWFAAGAIALLVLGLLAYSLFAGPSAALQPGSEVPEFRLSALDGTPMDLSALRGKVVVTHFFASWCAPCRQEAPDLQHTWHNYQGQEVQFLGIAYKDAAASAQAFVDEFGVTYPVAVDPGNRIARAYGVTGVPETFVIDRAGNLLHHFVGSVTEAELSRQIDGLLQR